ncbi:MAG: hypothetical protein GX567_05480 [Clostridia bacterium]|nr:hypothetical protein [Clostridia bacterium]
MILLISIISILINCFIYMIFGSLIIGDRKGQGFSFTLACVIGFFLYHSIFMIACVPLMLKFQPLSYMVVLWLAIVSIVLVVSVVLCRKKWLAQLKKIKGMILSAPSFYAFLLILCITQIVLIAGAYNFTLDATYYVGNVATSVATDSMNIYDPYTGNWQDHFEMRYFFATYSMNDAVICKLTGIPALVQTKIIMTSVVVIFIQFIYYQIAIKLFPDNKRAAALMIFLMAVVNFTFITIYTSSNFLITRTFEGKSIVGNVVLVLLLYMYMRMLDQTHTI